MVASLLSSLSDLLSSNSNSSSASSNKTSSHKTPNNASNKLGKMFEDAISIIVNGADNSSSKTYTKNATLDDKTSVAPADKKSRDYITFIASQQAGKNKGSESFSDKVEKVAASIAESMGISSDEIQQISVDAGIETQQSASAYFASSGTSLQYGASVYQSMSAHYDAQLTTSDGQTITIDADFQMESSASVEVWQSSGQTTQADPLALDLDGDGDISLSSVQNGAQFDINGDGLADKTAFVTGNDAFLALDKNNNGRIDDGSELFGDQNGASNGFEELAKYDDDQNGIIDSNDAVYSQLKAIHQAADGALEMQDLQSLGVKSISLNYENGISSGQNGNVLAQRSTYQGADNTNQSAIDVLLNYQTLKLAA